MQGKPTLIETLRELAHELGQRQAEYVEHHVAFPGDGPALDAAVAMDEAAVRLATYEAALREIAAYNDDGANEILDKVGSYGAFDEPASVKIARKALEHK